MARPRQFDRDQAIETAMNEMWNHGYQACSVKALAETLGISRSSFYNTFGSRAALFQLSLDLYLTRIPEAALFDPPDDVGPLELLTSVFRNACRHRAADHERRGCLAANSIAELAATAGPEGDLVRHLSDSFRERLETVLTQARDQSLLDRDADIKTLALAAQSLLIGVNMQAKLGRTDDQLWAMTQATLKGLGLAAR